MENEIRNSKLKIEPKKKLWSLSVLGLMVLHLLVVNIIVLAVNGFDKFIRFSSNAPMFLWSFAIFFPIVLGLTALYLFLRFRWLNIIVLIMKLCVTAFYFFWMWLGTLVQTYHNPTLLQYNLIGLPFYIGTVFALVLLVFELFFLRRSKVQVKNLRGKSVEE